MGIAFFGSSPNNKNLLSIDIDQEESDALGTIRQRRHPGLRGG